MTVSQAASPQPTPAWTASANGRVAFARGLMVMCSTPGAVLFLSALGFGSLVRDAGLTLNHALFLSSAMYALPAQVMLVDQLQRGTPLLAIALAVTLTAVRLLPMTVSLTPYLRGPGGRWWMRLLAVHFIAITSWVEGSQRLPHIPEALRLKHFLGIGAGMMAATAGGSAVGFLLAGEMPRAAQAALLFMTPLYFMLSTLGAANQKRDWVAIVLGGALAPLVYLAWPGADLLLAGLVGGTAAYFVGRVRS